MNDTADGKEAPENTTVNDERPQDSVIDSVPSPNAGCSVKTSRFASLDNDDIQGIIGESRSKATDKNTGWAVRLFKEWLQERHYPSEFEEDEVDVLNNKLRQFYAEVRSADGKMYCKSTFIGLRAGLNRHLRSPPFERDVTLMNDPEFHTSNNVFQSVIRKMKKDGLDKTNHHASLSRVELETIRESFDQTDAKSLQMKVWFDITLGFARRGNENQRAFTKSTFRVSTDENNVEFLEMAQSELTKNHRGGLRDEETNKRVYATGGTHCPVPSFKSYLSHLNPSNDIFFQKSKAKLDASGKVWFTSRPLGVNTLGGMMKSICESAGLDKVYTNHCLRATAVTLLSHAGVEAGEICKVTGHRNEQSSRSYCRESSSAQKRAYSSILQGEGQIDEGKMKHSLSVPNSGMFQINNSSVTVNNYFANAPQKL